MKLTFYSWSILMIKVYGNYNISRYKYPIHVVSFFFPNLKEQNKDFYNNTVKL